METIATILAALPHWGRACLEDVRIEYTQNLCTREACYASCVTKSRFTAQYDRFLARIKALRSSRGIVQADLAKRLGVPQQYISRFETGETRMDVAQLWHYCRALGVSFPKVCRDLDREFAETGGGRNRSARQAPRARRR